MSTLSSIQPLINRFNSFIYSNKSEKNKSEKDKATHEKEMSKHSTPMTPEKLLQQSTAYVVEPGTITPLQQRVITLISIMQAMMKSEEGSLLKVGIKSILENRLSPIEPNLHVAIPVDLFLVVQNKLPTKCKEYSEITNNLNKERVATAKKIRGSPENSEEQILNYEKVFSDLVRQQKEKWSEIELLLRYFPENFYKHPDTTEEEFCASAGQPTCFAEITRTITVLMSQNDDPLQKDLLDDIKKWLKKSRPTQLKDLRELSNYTCLQLYGSRIPGAGGRSFTSLFVQNICSPTLKYYDEMLNNVTREQYLLGSETEILPSIAKRKSQIKLLLHLATLHTAAESQIGMINQIFKLVQHKDVNPGEKKSEPPAVVPLPTTPRSLSNIKTQEIDPYELQGANADWRELVMEKYDPDLQMIFQNASQQFTTNLEDIEKALKNLKTLSENFYGQDDCKWMRTIIDKMTGKFANYAARLRAVLSEESATKS